MSRATVGWLARRLLLAVVVVFGAATAAFLALRLVPGDPVRVLLGTSPATPRVVDQIRRDLGFDEPIPVQYLDFLGRLAHGDLGTSYQLQQPVGALIASQFPATLELAVAGLALALLVAVPAAVLTSSRWPIARAVCSGLELVATSTPGFWVGVLLLAVFSFRLHLFPATSGTDLLGLVLPAVTLAAGLVGPFAQVCREGLERALEAPFVFSARARGTGQLAVRLRHALRHALSPLLTMTGWTIGALLGGAVIVETVFNRPGLGRILAIAVVGRDIPVVTGIVVLSAVVFGILNIGVDWLYRLIDPRLRETAR